MKAKISGFVYKKCSPYDGPNDYIIFSSPNASDEYYALIGPMEFDYEIPDNFDPRKSMVAAMQSKIADIQATSQMEVIRLQGRINELLAIENKMEAA